MMPLTNILVPTDFSATAARALDYGKALAETFRATLHVLFVMEDPFLTIPTLEGYTPLPRFREDMERDARRQLDQVLTPDERARFHAQLVMVWGRPAVEILEYAQTHGIDLIVMGTHGRGGLSHLLLGSVAEEVVRQASCPVLTVRAREPDVPPEG
ncbi:MAG: universal stress protein [Gemmataceae bacterium]